MKIVEVATERRVTIVMFTIAIVLFGLVSLSRLKVNLLPDLSYPTITVRTELDGAAPLEVENLITKPIEESVGIIKNVRQVRSVSRSGQSDVILEFAWGTDMDIAGVEVREKLDILELPLEAERPILLRFDPSNEPIQRIAMVHGDVQDAGSETARVRLRSLRRYAEDQLKNDLEGVEGTAAVKVSGGLEDEIQVLVDEEKLAQLGISIETVAGRIRAENVNLSGGRLEQGSQRFLVRTINEFENVDQIRDAIVATPGGRPLYLRDIATVERGYKEREAVTRVNGQESVELAVYKEGDANTVQVARRIGSRIEAIEDDLPDNIELSIVYDQSTFIAQAIRQVRSAAVIGGLLAVLVLYGFLRNARATAIIGVAIPVSVVGTFLMMYATDITLNIMSLGGIALAVGLLVDNSIVVLENIVRRREMGDSVLVAARRGTSEVATAVTAATLTTIAVFFPMVFVSGIAGQLFRDQALTVTFALAFSLLVALTLIPMLAAMGAGRRFSDPADDRAPGRVTRAVAFVIRGIGALFRILGRGLAFVARFTVVLPCQAVYRVASALYPPILRWALDHRMVVVGLAAMVFAATMTLVPRLGSELIPQLSQGEFFVKLRLSPGTPLAETDRVISGVEAAAGAQDGVDLTYSVAGTGNRLDASPVDAGEHSGQLNVNMGPGLTRADEARVIDGLRSELRRLPGVNYEIGRPTLFTFRTPLEVEISGYDLAALSAAAAAVQSRMEASGHFVDVKSSHEDGNPEVQIIFDHEKAARLGLVVRDVADRVVSMVRGDVATRYTWRDKKIDVLVRSVDTRAASVAEIEQLLINPQSERPVPLSAVADVLISSGPAEIRRIDQERVIVISSNIAKGDLSTAVAEIENILASVPMPAGVGARASGQSEEMQDSFNSMLFTLAMAVFLVYLVMASQFESLMHPLVIMFTIPLALVGAVLALFLTGTTINVVVFIGLIMLAGIVVNNAIVLVDLVNQLKAQGKSRHEAIMEAGQARLRPILMTTLTTTLGLLPMAIGLGEGAEVRAPMAVTVIGGLIVSTVLTLVVIPVVYSLLDRKQTPAGEQAAPVVGATP
jgi:HAE1 family hydrophobic/amphiphilic exporter-1